MRRTIHKIETILSDQIRKDTQYNWREETVVLNLLTELRKVLNNRSIDHLFGETYKINFKVFQAFGSLENKFGDISLIIIIHYPGGITIEGVGFLEAKIRKFKSSRFESLRVSQLSRINRNAPRSLLMLIDYDPIVTAVSIKGRYYDSVYYTTHCVTTQVNSALALGQKDTSLYKIAIPFSKQLINRYFKGLDLEFKRESIEQAKGYSEKKGYPEYTVSITISPQYLEIKQDLDINQEVYNEVK